MAEQSHSKNYQYFYDGLKQYAGVDKAAVYDIETMSPGASSPDYTALPNEIPFLLKAFADASADKFEDVQTNGFSYAGEKYFFVRAETDQPACLIGRKRQEGIVICKTLNALLIAHHGPDIPVPVLTKHVQGWAGYLIQYEAADAKK